MGMYDSRMLGLDILLGGSWKYCGT
jgi:hypothetical protein